MSRNPGRSLTVGARVVRSVAGVTVAFLAVFPEPSRAQVSWQDLVFTGGVSAEGYRGDLLQVTVPAVDPADRATAVSGEMGGRGVLSLFDRPGSTLQLQLDGGLRQFSARGFQDRDYAPREWVGQADLGYRHRAASLGLVWLEGTAAVRSVEDRPPIPLFLQPGHLTGGARAGLQLLPRNGILMDAEISGEMADYRTSELTPQLDLLDRWSVGAEVGATWGSSWTLRVHGGARLLAYENQGTFDPGDPYRRDRALSLGATWTVLSPLRAQVDVDGTFNRSNSRRPEYNALRVQALVGAPLPWGAALNLFAAVTAKDYLNPTEFARLVPGEEADNASQVYLELARPLLVNLDGAVRFGWTRAETEFGESYFRRYGMTVLLRFRPLE